eukprot:TRINITY_DN2135_c0_g1_i1.p1 TRINITY_DN2135_c0_g1~~TRINITY_DN2135_c0_g1_i1.p1  ORF type:complete len:290 (+),score=57.88 TRINITY_DN2135_c0_g1_i1:3-872(+)
MESKDTKQLHHLLPFGWERKVGEWLQEDIPSYDYGGFVVGTTPERAVLYGKSPGVLAGVPFVTEIFKQVGCTIKWNIEEGAEFTPIAEIAEVHGPARNILQGERVALNLIARASGIATYARRLVTLAKENGFKGRIAGTRKTTPGFRIVEKYAMLVGGADTHRHDLSSMVMLKDNHITSAGSIPNAIAKAREACGFSLKIEVEARNKEEAELAASSGADVVMLDNFEPDHMREVSAQLKKAHPHVLLEASGGITQETIVKYFADGVDVISLGGMTQGVPHVDYSLKIRH